MVAPLVFDRRLVRLRRDRAVGTLADHGFLFDEGAARLADRLDDIRRAFPVAIELGSRGGALARAIGDRGRIGTLIRTDLSPAPLAALDGPRVVADEEALPFAAASLDAVLSNLALHEVNDLPGALLQIRRALKPDGLLLASMLGGATLHELRAALAEAEEATTGGASPRVAPFADAADIGALLQRAGFALPVVDTDTVEVAYAEPLDLLGDLKGMGASNALADRRRVPMARTMLAATRDALARRYTDADGRVHATFEIVTLTAWAPATSQPRPKPRGSATVSLKRALDDGV
jgi:SAM-dependent methyltransferase